MYLSKYLDQPEAEKPKVPEARSTLGEMGAGFKRGLFVAVPEMAGGAIKSIADVDSDLYKKGQDLQESARAIAGLPDFQKSKTAEDGTVNKVLVAGAEGVGQMAPVIAGSIINPYLGAGMAAGMYGGSTYQDTKERMLKQEGLDDRFAADNPNDPRVQKAKTTGAITGGIQGLGEAGMTLVGGKFIKAALPTLGKSTVQSVLGKTAEPGLAALKQYAKGLGLQLAGETITEPLQDEGQAAVERAAGLKDAPAFMEQAAQSAQGGFGTALLLAPFGIPAHVASYSKQRSVQQALVDPAADPKARAAAAHLVAGDLAKIDPAAADNFLQHSAVAIGDEATTGSAPYALDLTDESLLQPFVAPNPSVTVTDNAQQVSATPGQQADTTTGAAGASPAPGGAVDMGDIPAFGQPTVARDAVPAIAGGNQYQQFADQPFSNAPAQPAIAGAGVEGMLSSLQPVDANGSKNSLASAVLAGGKNQYQQFAEQPFANAPLQPAIAGPAVEGMLDNLQPATPSERFQALQWANQQMQDPATSKFERQNLTSMVKSSDTTKQDLVKYWRSSTNQRKQPAAIAGLPTQQGAMQANDLQPGEATQVTADLPGVETVTQPSAMAAAAPAKTITTVTKRDRSVKPTQDDLITAIGKLGGINRDQAITQWGNSIKDSVADLNRHASREGKSGILHVVSSKGKDLDLMREALEEHGYLPTGSTIEDMYAKIEAGTSGQQSYSNQKEYQEQDYDYPFDLDGIDFPPQRNREKHRKFLKRMLKGAKTGQQRDKIQKALDNLESKNKVTVPALNGENKHNITVSDLKSLKKGDVIIHSRNGVKYQFVGVDQDKNGSPGLIVKQVLQDGSLSKSQSYLPLSVGLQKELQQGGDQTGGQFVPAESDAPRKSTRLLEDSSRGRAVAHMSSVKSVLEAQGYEVIARIKQDADLKKMNTVQFEIGWKGLPLLVANRRFTDDKVKLLLAAGLHTKDVNGVQQKTSFGAYNDLMWAELESLSQLGLPVNVQLEGEGSHKWFVDNLQDAKDIKRGNDVTITFSGNKPDFVVEYNKEHDALAKEATNNASDWNNTTAFYDAATIDPTELGQDTSVILYKGKFDASRTARQRNGGSAGTDPGWTGTGSRTEVRDTLDRVSGSLRLDSAALSDLNQSELDTAFDGWGEEPVTPQPVEPAEKTPSTPATSGPSSSSVKHKNFLQRMLKNAKTAKAKEQARKALARLESRQKPVPTTIDDEINSMSLDAMAALFSEAANEAAAPAPVRNRAKLQEARRKQLAKQLAKTNDAREQRRLHEALEKLKAAKDKLAEANKPKSPAGKPEKDNAEDPYFKKGDRIQFANGVHGTISKVESYTAQTALLDIDGNGIGIKKLTEERNHSYTVRKDNGVEAHGYFSNMEKETDPAPEVIPAPSYNGTSYDPDTLLSKIKSTRKSADDSRDAASRSRKADKIDNLKQAADRYSKEADELQAAFDTWAKQYPEEAAKFQPVAVPSPAPTAAGIAVAGVRVTYNAAQNGIELRFAGKPDADLLAKIKANGFRWAMGKKIWYAKDTPSRRAFAEGLQGKKASGIDWNLKAAEVGRQAFENGESATPAKSSALNMLIKQAADAGEGNALQIIDAFAKAWHSANLEKPVEEKTIWNDDGTNGPVAITAPPSTRSASDILGAAASSGVKGADEALKGLYELFGGKSLKSFPGAVDEATYKAAKPHFEAALENFRAAGKSLKEFFSFLIDQFGSGIQPYVMKFLQEKQQESGILKVEDNGNDTTANDSTGQGSLESGLPGTVSTAATEGGTAEGSGSSSQPDADGNENPDAGGSNRTGGMGSKPESVRTLPGKEPAGSAVLPSGTTGSVTTPSEPRGQKLSGTNPGNYRITAADDLGGGTRGQKIDANLAAIRLVKQLDKDGRYPTREEQAVLVKYTGWGGLKSVFDPNSSKPQDQKARTELEQLLTKTEFFEARQSVLNAHYTSPEIIGSIYKMLDHMGFKGGNVLEPTYGAGNFIGLMPDAMAASSKWYGSELDPVTSKIGQFLYPNAQLLESGFQEAEFPYGKFDLAIGNPPFGAEQITDTNKKRADINRFKIHNYVIAKSGMHLRPGGVMAMVVTSRFMDTANPEARDYLAKQFKFLTAIRLPNDAFAKNAGTEVITDLVFFQKLMPGENAEDQYKGWLETDSRMTNAAGEEITLNKWFAKRPELMLGEPSMKGTMYGGQWRQDEGKGEFTLNARPGQDTAAEIETLLQNDELFGRVKNAFTPTPAKAEAAAVSIQMNREDIGIGGYVEENGEIFMREDDDAQGNPVFIKLTADTPWTEKQTLGETRLARIKGMLSMREAAYKLIEAERFDLSEMEALRKDLNKQYDAFVAKHGYLSDSANASLMADDVKIESGLEVNYRKAITAAKAKTMGVKPQPAKADKAAILQQRVFFPVKEITSAASARDGYGISLSERGKLDLEYIAGLTGQTREEVIAELSEEGLIFKDPSTGNWIQEDAYLSGNVKAKLAKVQGREGFEKNAEALTKVLPEDVAAEDIFADLGATWIPAEIYKEFGDLLGVTNANVVVIPETGTVKIISGGHVQNDMNVMLQNPDHDVASLINHIAAKQAVVAYDTIDDKRVVNKERTKALVPMVKRVAATFRDWLMADPRRAQQLTQLYNDTMNTHAPRVFNGKHLKTVGASPAVRLRNSQRNAAWRMLQSPVVLLDHVVGAGKTFTIITGVMERKRLGLSNKAMVVVPNHLVGQWGADFLKLYPGARVLATTEKDFAKANRRRLFARIATGNYDAIIVGHSSFGFIPLEPNTNREFIEEEISYLERALVQAEQTKDKRLIRNITEKIAKKRERIKSLMDGNRDDVVTFENMGIDNLVVDESHEFKNLEYSTGMQNITGMGNPQGAKKSFDLYAKIQYLRKGDGAVTFATGTPISNSLVEMYTILRYLNREELKGRRLDVFDAWAKAYASIESRIEYTASQKLKDRQVMATFNNLPELLQLYSEFADVISMKDLKRIYAEQIRESNKATGAQEREEFPIPNVKSGARYLDVADPTTQQRQYMDYLVARANRLEKLGGSNDPKTDNHLWLMNDARKMALDIRLVDPSAASDPGNKVNRAANNIKRIYDQWHADKGAQLVFCDLSTPAGSSKSEAARFIKSAAAVLGLEKDKSLERVLSTLSYSEQWAYLKGKIERELDRLDTAEVSDANDAAREKLEKFLESVGDEELSTLTTVDTGFSVYDDLKATLIAKGIPASEIRFIHEANTNPQKQELFNMVNSGMVRVLIGSSRKMGAGTNAQERLVALHHMDAPWRPSDVEQREGRIIRQGNVLYERDPEGFEVEIPAYSTRNTFDSVSWQILARKAEMLEDFRSGARTMQDSDSDAASYAEFMAESTGNPAFREKFRLEREIEELESTERNIKARRAAGERIVKNADADIAKAEKNLQSAQKDLEEIGQNPKFTVEGKTYADDLTQAYNTALQEYEQAHKEYTSKLLPEYVAAAQAIEEQELDDKAKKAALKEIKKPVEPAKPTLARLEKTSQAARAALRVSELLDDVAERGEVEFTLGGTQVVISKVPAGNDTFDFRTEVNGTRRWKWDANNLKHMSQQKLMDLFSTGEINSRVAADLRTATMAVEQTKQTIADAERTLAKLKFEDADKLTAMQERYKAVVEEVNQLEKDMEQKREQDRNSYIEGDRSRFGAENLVPTGGKKGQFSLTSPTTTGLNAADLQKEFSGLPFASKIKVVQSTDQLPGIGRQSLGLNIEGQYKDGTIYLVAGNLPSVERAKIVALGHELAHAGQSVKVTDMAVNWFRDAMAKGENGSKFQQATMQILKIEAAKRGYNINKEADFRKAVQEATAVIAETAYRTGAKAGLMTRLLMYLKHFMRTKLGWKTLPFTDKELVATVSMMMRHGQQNLTNGKGPDGGQFAAAWHGSPHDHNKFSTEHIGTGEGAQAYGYGLYFAGNREVAEWYRNNLSKDNNEDIAIKLFNVNQDVVRIMRSALTMDGFGDNPRMALVGSVMQEFLNGNRPSNHTIELLGDNFGEVRDAILDLQKSGAIKQGRLYKVELAPAEDEYLLWDKPLSEQSEKVKAALVNEFEALKEDYKDSLNDPIKMTGAEFYRGLSQDSDKAASEYLHYLGIRGIKYLDGNSRNRPMKDIKKAFLAELPEDSDFNEVMELIGTGKFSTDQESLLKALEADDWLGFDYPAQAISAALGNDLNGFDPSQALRDAVQQLAKDQQFNYVIFNDEDVTIEDKFSLASSVSATLSDVDWKAAAGSVQENWKQIANPLDWSRTARWFDDWTPESIKAAFGYMLAVPHFQAERDATKRPFVDASENREIDRMDMMLQFLGFNPGQDDTCSVKEKTWDFFTKWQSGQHQTDWEKMNQRRADLPADQQKALDALFVEGDVSSASYSSLEKALTNPRIARTKPSAETFALYRDIRNHMDNHVAKIREQRMERMMREAGVDEGAIKAHIADYRNDLREVGGWMTRNHGDGEHAAAIYHVVKDLKFEIREVKDDKQQAYLPYFPGNAVHTRLVDLAKQAGHKIKVTPRGAIIVTGDQVQGFVDEASKIIPEIGPQRVMVFSRYHQTKGAARNHADLIKKDLKAAMPHNFRPAEQYEVITRQVDTLNESMYQNMRSDMAVEALLEQSAQRALKRGDMSKEQYTEFKNDLVQNTAEVLMGRAAGRYQIRRADYLIEGYDTENAVSLYQDYMMGVSGMMSKADYAAKQFENFRTAKIPVKQWAAPYIFDSLRNQGLGDRISGNLRAFASLWYMGLKPASAIINSTQNYTLGWAELSRHMKKGSALALIGKANADIIKGKLTSDEEQLFESAIYRQQEMGSALAEITGHNEAATSKAGKLLHNMTSKALALFQNVEIMNRKTMILAGYRAFKSKDTKPGMVDQAAFEKAMEINSSVNFNMHRGNLPGWARNPVGHTLYALQSFTFNSLNWIFNRMTSGEKRDVMALLRYAGAIVALGGVSALAGGDELDKLYRKLFGKSVKLEFQQFTHKNLKQYGSFGELVDAFAWHGAAGAAGVNISNSLRLQIPVVSQLLSGEGLSESAAGVFGGLLKKGSTAIRAAAKGDAYRAVEAAAPEAVSGAMRAYRQYDRGVTTLGGKQVYDENGQPLKYSAADATLRLAGLQPMQQSKRTEVSQIGREIAAEWRENRQNVIDAIRLADTPAERQKTLKLVQNFNVDLRGSQAAGLVQPITLESIRNAVSQRKSKADKNKAGWLQNRLQ